MKNNYDIVIATSSWEERFRLGIEKDFSEFVIGQIIIINNLSNPHPNNTRDNLDSLLEGITSTELDIVDIDFGSTVDIWNKLSSNSIKEKIEGKKVLFDITTTPREIIWYVLYFLNESNCKVDYIYHKPSDYTTEWLTKDPRKPRFIVKHSGISEFGKPTGLFILTGFDYNRTEQLINFYEPKLIILGVQENNNLDKGNRNEQLHEKLIKQYKDNIVLFKIDSYNEKQCVKIIESNLSAYLDKFNFIMSSLGPKVSAIALYKIFIKHPEIAITYVRSHEYNIEYSNGLGDYCFGEI